MDLQAQADLPAKTRSRPLRQPVGVAGRGVAVDSIVAAGTPTVLAGSWDWVLAKFF